MAKMIITVGLPASGKSTFAEDVVKHAPRTVNTNRDDLRFMMYGVYFGEPIDENEVTNVQHGIINNALKKDKDVIVSDTNLNKRFVKSLVKIAEKWGAQVEFEYFDVPLSELIARDEERACMGKRAVGREVIEGMAKRYGIKWSGYVPRYDFTTVTQQTKPYVPPVGQPNAIIVDLDGTVALHKRSPYDYDSLDSDEPNEAVIRCVKNEYAQGTHILFTSGRPDSHFDMTVEWLEKHIGLYPRIPGRRAGMPRVELFMRKASDMRMDVIVKHELFDEHIRDNFNVLYCFDDRNQVVDGWRRIGLTVYQVADGEF